MRLREALIDENNEEEERCGFTKIPLKGFCLSFCVWGGVGAAGQSWRGVSAARPRIRLTGLNFPLPSLIPSNFVFEYFLQK